MKEEIKEIKAGSPAIFCSPSRQSGTGLQIDVNYGQTGVVYTAMNTRRRTDRQRFFFVADGDPKQKPHVVVRTDFYVFGENPPTDVNPRYARERAAQRTRIAMAYV